VEVVDAHVHGVTEGDWRPYVRALASKGTHVSRTYRYPWAVVAHHHDAVGVDLERLDAIGAGDRGFASATCTPDELAGIDRGEYDDLVDLWSGKEALAKALGDPLGYEPRRLDAPRTWALDAGEGVERRIPGLRRRGIWVARRLPLSGETGRRCLGWLVWRDPKTAPDLRERPM